MTLYGADPRDHRMFADHLTAEYRERGEAPAYGRTVYEWFQRPHHPDNHLLDAVVGCAVAASMLGTALPGMAPPPKPARKVISFQTAQADAKRKREAFEARRGGRY